MQIKDNEGRKNSEKTSLLLSCKDFTLTVYKIEDKKMKLGIIRCQQTEDFCPGSGCFKAVNKRKGVFEGCDEEIEVIGFITCGGCPGKKSILRAKMLIERGADTIAFASCIQKGTPIGYPCPFHKRMKTLLETNLPENIRILDYTHDAPVRTDV